MRQRWTKRTGNGDIAALSYTQCAYLPGVADTPGRRNSQIAAKTEAVGIQLGGDTVCNNCSQDYLRPIIGEGQSID